MCIYIYVYTCMKKNKRYKGKLNLIRICSSGDKALEFSIKKCSRVSPLCGCTTMVTGGSCAQATLAKRFQRFRCLGQRQSNRTSTSTSYPLTLNTLVSLVAGREKQTFSLHLVTSLVRVKPTAASFHRVVDGDHAQGPEYPSCVSWFQNNFNVEIEKQKLQGDRTACQIDSTEKNRAKVAH